jgi:hypothetical protein
VALLSKSVYVKVTIPPILLSKSMDVKIVIPPASEQRGNNFKCFRDFNLKVKASIGP